jgi:acyl-CoA thioesterase-1
MLYPILIALFLSINVLSNNAWAAPPAQAVAQALPKEDTKKVLVVFGDSLSAGYGVPPGQSYPDDLQRKLDAQGYTWRVVNLGISGDTTSGGLARISTGTALRPAMVLLELGGNDGLRGLPLAMTRENLDQMIATFERAGARVVLAGMTLPPNYGPDYVHSFEAIYTGLAAKYKLPLIPFLLQDIAKEMRYFQRDGIHPTAEGAQIVSDTVFRVIKPLLGAVKN